MDKNKINNGKRLQKAQKRYQLLERNDSSTTCNSADDSGTLTWNSNISFVVRPYYESCTETCLIIGHEKLLSLLSKQRIENVITLITWMKYFFESQGRYIKMNLPLIPLGSDFVIEQDNTSASQLAKKRMDFKQ